ncbi:GNAT family N-acetyltransferase [Fredinandcohnia humi]
MEIHTKRLKLVPCTTSSWKTSNYPLLDHIQYTIDKAEEDDSTVGWYVWLANRIEDGKTVGDLGFKGIPGIEGNVEIGYGISPDEHNKGYATEAVTALINWAFSQPNVTKITAECTKDNVPSIRVLEKVGMNRIGEANNMIYWELPRG